MSSLPPPTPPTPSAGRPGPPQAPPGFVPYPVTGTVTVGSFRRLGSLAKAMLILLACSAGLQIVVLPVTVAVRSKASDFLSNRISQDDFEDALGTQNAVQGLQGGLIIALVVLTMIWMFRLAGNHRSLGRPGSSWNPGWAIGGWFVPPGAIYAVPWLMLRELWKGSDPANEPGDPAWKQRRVTPLLTVWWILYGFVPLLGVIAFAGIFIGTLPVDDLTEFAERLDDYFWLQLGLGIVSVVTHAVFAKIVFDLTRRQQALTGER